MKLLTSTQAAEQLGVGSRTIRRWAQTGVLQARLTAGGHLRFAPSEIAKLSEGSHMSVRREDGWWTVQFRATCPATGRDVRPHQRPATNTRAAALRLERDLRRRIAAGEWFVPEAIKVSGFWARFEAWARANLAESTAKGYESIWRVYLRDRWGQLELTELRTWRIEELRTELAGRSKKTANNVLACIGTMMRVAEEWELIRERPKAKLHRLQPARLQEYRHLDRKQAGRLIAACKDPRLRSMVAVAVRTGLRLGELRVLRWCDVDARAREIQVRQSLPANCKTVKAPKGGQPRSVPMSPAVVKALEAWPRGIGDALVWPTRTGSPVDASELERQLRDACERAGLEPIGWHVLRHTCGTWLSAAGIPARTIQEWLGHASIQMTERYTHAVPATLREAAERLG